MRWKDVEIVQKYLLVKKIVIWKEIQNYSYKQNKEINK
jgi:hypothetical protein